MKNLLLSLLLSVTSLTFTQGAEFALGLDGVNDFVSIPHTNALNAFPLTATAWVRAAKTNAQGGLLTKYRFAPSSGNGGWQLKLVNGNIHATYVVDAENYVGGDFGLDGGPVADGRLSK